MLLLGGLVDALTLFSRRLRRRVILFPFKLGYLGCVIGKEHHRSSIVKSQGADGGCADKDALEEVNRCPHIVSQGCSDYISMAKDCHQLVGMGLNNAINGPYGAALCLVLGFSAGEAKSAWEMLYRLPFW